MMTPDVGPARPGLELFDELRRSQDVWIDRTEEAQALAEAIRTSASRIVVLVGPERAGKTELVRRWLMPMLASDRTVVYRDARDGRAPDEDLPPRSVVFWDSFEACSRMTPSKTAASSRSCHESRVEVVPGSSWWCATNGRAGSSSAPAQCRTSSATCTKCRCFPPIAPSGRSSASLRDTASRSRATSCRRSRTTWPRCRLAARSARS